MQTGSIDKRIKYNSTYKNENALNVGARECLWGYLFVFFVSFQYAFVNTQLEFRGGIRSAVFAFEVLLFFLHVIQQRYSFRALVLFFTLIFISFITYYKTGSSYFMILLMVAIVFEKIDSKKAAVLMFRVRLILLLFTILCSIAGIIDLYKREIGKSETKTVIGYGLGFTHPNRLAFAILYLVFLFVFINIDDLSLKKYMKIIISTTLGFLITQSRTLVICVVMCVVLIQLSRRYSDNKIHIFVLQKVFPFISIICSAISIVVPLMMLSSTGKLLEFLYWVNGSFNSRFTHVYRAFLNYPVTLFGGISDFSMMDSIYNYSTVDNGYVRLLYGFGILGFTLYNLFTLLSLKKISKNESAKYIPIIVVISFWGISENVLLSFAYNLIPIFWCELLKSDNKEKRIE